MKWFATLVLLFITMGNARAQPSLQNAERVVLSGSEYVRLKDWSDAVNLTVRWIRRDEELLLTNRWCKINFTVKSIQSKFNGMDVRLSLPVVSKNGGVYISAVDLQNTLHPLLFPPKNAAGDKVNLICIDPGHGGKDKGKIDKLNYEKKYTLLLGEEISRLLKQNGMKVIFTRISDKTLDLPVRTEIANRNKADLFLSLHFNAFHIRSVRGSEIYSMTPAGVESSNSGPGKSSIGNSTGNQNNAKNMLLAYTIQRSILRGTGLEDRGVKRARYEVLRGAKMPAVLIEGGFMSNSDEARRIYDADFRKKLARAIVDGVMAYKKIVEGNSAVGVTATN